MAWGETAFQPPAASAGTATATAPDVYHDLPEQIIIGEGPKISPAWVSAIVAAVIALALVSKRGR